MGFCCFVTIKYLPLGFVKSSIGTIPPGGDRANRAFDKAQRQVFNCNEATKAHSIFYKLSKNLEGGRGAVDQNLPRYSTNTLYGFFDKQKTYKMLDKKRGVIHQRYCLKCKNSWKKLKKKKQVEVLYINYSCKHILEVQNYCGKFHTEFVTYFCKSCKGDFKLLGEFQLCKYYQRYKMIHQFKINFKNRSLKMKELPSQMGGVIFTKKGWVGLGTQVDIFPILIQKEERQGGTYQV